MPARDHRLALKDALLRNPEQIALAGHLIKFDIPLKGCSDALMLDDNDTTGSTLLVRSAVQLVSPKCMTHD
jgi:hypothetical protein